MRRRATNFEPAPTRTATSVVAGSGSPVWLMGALLVLVTVAIYWPVMRHDFVNYDDNLYVTANVHVQGSLTLENMKWACFHPVGGNWHPLTMWSHMADCQLFGLKPWGHHLTSVLFHALNTVLVFVFLRGMTGAFWRSALVAALFGLHPLHVESVAWVAERKDMLSTCLGLLSLMFYARYGRKRLAVENVGLKARGVPAPQFLDYLLALMFFALGLMSKPMLVTWPFVLLLLDYWPLERFKPSHAWRLLTEKIPFFALAAVVSVVTFAVQKQGDSVLAAEALPLGVRSGNALISYCRYLGKLFWPTDLAVFYPHPGHWPLERVLLAGGLIAGVSVPLFVQWRRYPFLLMGWLWFCGTLVPVIGLVPMGIQQAMADRYSYIPSLGVLVLAVWGVCELTKSWHYRVVALSVAGSAAVVLCLALTRQQLGYWRDSEALFRHALEVTEDNYLAHLNLGSALDEKGRIDEAIREFQDALRLKPDYVLAHNNLGVALVKKGQLDEGISQYREALRLKPDYAFAHNNLAIALVRKGQSGEAIREFREAIRLKAGSAEAHYNLGIALVRKGQLDEAIRELEEAIRLKPDYAFAHNNLGIALNKESRIDEAIREFREAIRLKMDYALAHSNLGTALVRKGQIDEAIRELEEAIRLKPDDAEAHHNLAQALAMKNAPTGR